MKKVIIPRANFCFCAPITRLKLGVQGGDLRGCQGEQDLLKNPGVSLSFSKKIIQVSKLCFIISRF